MSTTDADTIVDGSSVTEDRAAFNLMFSAMGALAGGTGVTLWSRLGGSLGVPTWALVALLIMYGVLAVVAPVLASPHDV